MRTFSFLSILIWAVSFTSSGQSLNRYAIIPRPAQLDARPGEFIVSRATTLTVPAGQPALKAVADSFANQINRSTKLGVAVQIANAAAINSAANTIRFLPARDTTLGNEGYRIDATDSLITV